ncbi:diguanylate cyclase [Vibrio sp. B1FLJ16]|uniref:GGDEF domain-containing protein n=1 Tax=Vibrio sp. B1FLJ16 TaxID=2751178 RepID=UPI0015F43EBE|nr:GGDEF domain-containing protein [Vibrio sp. B1FLJ16]CAD7821247.1 diguanylate cyclase [Vibrio sp. B1FLJ16]CAE6945598.1 diguanylate cyclase [Vibrio sp. B1FLJ16]
MTLKYKNITLALITATLLFVTTLVGITMSVTSYREKQFSSYVETLKNIRQRIILFSMLTESELENHRLLSAEEVESATELSFDDMIISEEPGAKLDFVEAVARKVLHDAEVYLFHTFEKPLYFFYFRSFTDNKFILERHVEGIDDKNIGFSLELCQEYGYCILSAWKGQLSDRILVSKPFDSVITGQNTISLMAPVYLDNKIVGEYAALIDNERFYDHGKAIKTSLSDGNRNIVIYYPGYPFPELYFSKSFVIDNFNVLVYKYPMSKVFVDYFALWPLFFVLCMMYFSKFSEAQEGKLLLDNALTDVTKDELTGLYNRRLFKDDAFNVRLNKAPYTVMAIDGNRIKRINDKYGHHVGDDAIAIIAESMQKVFRNSDYLVRTGGDEFLAILPSCSLSQASVLSDKLQGVVKDNRLKTLDIEISVCIGLATSEEHESLEDVIIRADEELYEMKKKRD